MPELTAGEEMTVVPSRVVRERNRVTRRDIRPGIIWRILILKSGAIVVPCPQLVLYVFVSNLK